MITSNISIAVNALNQGELVAIPTETVYGLAASIYYDNALKKIFEIPCLTIAFTFLGSTNATLLFGNTATSEIRFVFDNLTLSQSCGK